MLSFTCNSETVSLPSPELGDARNHLLGTQWRRAMSGNMYSHIKTPVRVILNLQFVNVKRAAKEAFEEFLLNYTGETVEMTDWDNRLWVGVILTDPIDFVTEATDRYTFSIEFEGDIYA